MDFKKIKRKFEGQVVSDEEFELLNELYYTEYVNSYGKYYGMYKYVVLSEGREDCFYIYYNKGEN